MELLNSYKRMHELIRDKGWGIRILQQDETVEFKDNKFELVKNTFVIDCPTEELGKILYMQKRVDKAYRGGFVTLEQIREVVDGVYGAAGEEKKTDEQTKLDFNR